MAGMFGTDGVRARINTGAMTAEAIVRLALASGRWFIDNNPEGRARPSGLLSMNQRPDASARRTIASAVIAPVLIRARTPSVPNIPAMRKPVSADRQ